jgi:hypothetical protein
VSPSNGSIARKRRASKSGSSEAVPVAAPSSSSKAVPPAPISLGAAAASAPKAAGGARKAKNKTICLDDDSSSSASNSSSSSSTPAKLERKAKQSQADWRAAVATPLEGVDEFEEQLSKKPSAKKEEDKDRDYSDEDDDGDDDDGNSSLPGLTQEELGDIDDNLNDEDDIKGKRGAGRPRTSPQQQAQVEFKLGIKPAVFPPGVKTWHWKHATWFWHSAAAPDSADQLVSMLDKYCSELRQQSSGAGIPAAPRSYVLLDSKWNAFSIVDGNVDKFIKVRSCGPECVCVILFH